MEGKSQPSCIPLPTLLLHLLCFTHTHTHTCILSHASACLSLSLRGHLIVRACPWGGGTLQHRCFSRSPLLTDIRVPLPQSLTSLRDAFVKQWDDTFRAGACRQISGAGADNSSRRCRCGQGESNTYGHGYRVASYVTGRRLSACLSGRSLNVDVCVLLH